MLAVFDKTVAKCPDALQSPHSAPATSVLKDGFLANHLASLHPGSVTVNLGTSGLIAYSLDKQNPLLPRLFAVVDDIFCLFQGHIENVAALKQQYGLNKTANEVIIVIEAYRTLRDRGPYPADQVVKDILGKFAFVLYDSTSKATFIAADADGSVPFFWGTDSEGNLVLSDDVQIVQKGCGKSFAPFPKGCFFTTSRGLRSFEHPMNELKPVPRVDSSGQVCGSTFKVDAETKKESAGMPRVDSSYNWYVPLSRTKVPLSTKNIPTPGCSFPSLSTSDEIGKVGSSNLIRCKFETVEAAAKVRTLEVCEASADEIRNFEYSCLGEVRVLGALQHSCVVEMYGHQLSSRWIPSEGNPERRIIQSIILMEYVNRGSLKDYLEEVSKTGEKHVPAEMALCIARDVACALAEIHSKDIIHRDIKSENILIDLDKKRADGMPLVKLCDFDRAVPLRSFLHTCCIAHRGVAPPDVCVGTPRWMAPEVLRAMDKRNTYGLDVDIWSYGCLLLELLTLQVPYTDLPDLRIHELLQSGKRPPLTDELEALGSIDEHLVTQSGSDLEGLEVESETLRFLVDLFCQCTKENPADRPKASDIYKLLLARTSV